MSRHKKERKFLEQGMINEAAMLAYLRNELDAEEKQQFEKLLKDDSFTQEALEGLQVTQNKTAISNSITIINQKVRERTGLKQKKTVSIHWTNYAWAVVLLGLLIGIGGALIIYVNKREDKIVLNNDVDKQSSETNLLESQQELKPSEPALSVMDSSRVSQSAQTVDSISASQSKGKTLQTQFTTSTNTDNSTEKIKSGTATVSTTPSVSVPSPSPDKVNAVTDKGNHNYVTPAKEKAVEPANNLKTSTPSETKSESVKSAVITTTQKIVRGAIIEREESDKTTVITVDDAMKNFNSGNYKLSGEQFEIILQQHPENADALYFGGISEYINGNTKKSEKNFDRLLKDGTKYVEGSKWYKANILFQKGKRDEAKKILDELSQSGGSYKERAIKKKAELEF